MGSKMSLKRPLAAFKLASAVRTPVNCRQLHRMNAPTLPIPKQTPFVPDVPTFLTLIGRGLPQHAAKIPSWEALFSFTSAQLREAGIEPARSRRYLLWWRERFRNGLIGIGGDTKHVKDGVAQLQIVQVLSKNADDKAPTPLKAANMKMMVSNVPLKEPLTEEAASRYPVLPTLRTEDVVPIKGTRLVSGVNISGKGLQPAKGLGIATIKVREGLWEQKRGVKIDGGERRRDMVRAKRRALERRNA